ncbi:hypothetical protein GVAV_003499 [Gurleya vavrai]
MKKTLKTSIVENCLSSLTTLQNLKTRYKDINDLSTNLLALESSFAKLNSLINVKNCDHKVKQIFKKDFLSFYIFNHENFEFNVYTHDKYGIIAINSKNLFLNELLMKKSNRNFEKLVEINSLYCDFETRICDFCGEFGRNGCELRIKEKDYIAAYHENCLYQLNNKI